MCLLISCNQRVHSRQFAQCHNLTFLSRTIHFEKEALAQAKRNIERHYAVVGLSEDLHGFFSILEVLAPHYFRGATLVYKRHGESFHTLIEGLATVFSM